ncbi:hypothetical protein IWZ00DRAFT_491078 [Phyllosticta capitalensis]|uniref:uncharacterized protein n=1 Tax=Phyllosticta capitalensis TaxID=121624 RepID=UPI00312D6F73
MSSTPTSYLATWLDACQNPNSNLSKVPTPYSESSVSRSDAFLPLLFGLLQCRSDIDRTLFELDMTQSLVDVETRLADMCSRFQRLVRNTRAEFWRDAAKIGVKDMPFEEIRFGESGAQATQDEDDLEESDSDVSSDDGADEVEMESDEPLRSGKDSKETQNRLVAASYHSIENGVLSQFQVSKSASYAHLSLRHLSTISRHRIGRFIAFAKGSGSRSVILQQAQRGAQNSASKDGLLASTEAIVAMAKSQLAEETQRESEATEAYRLAMIAVLQEELSR